MTTEQRVDRMEEWITKLSELVLEDREVLAEMRRENRQTRRIWIAFAKHHGWPEDWLDRDDLDWDK